MLQVSVYHFTRVHKNHANKRPNTEILINILVKSNIILINMHQSSTEYPAT